MPTHRATLAVAHKNARYLRQGGHGGGGGWEMKALPNKPRKRAIPHNEHP